MVRGNSVDDGRGQGGGSTTDSPLSPPEPYENRTVVSSSYIRWSTNLLDMSIYSSAGWQVPEDPAWSCLLTDQQRGAFLAALRCPEGTSVFNLLWDHCRPHPESDQSAYARTATSHCAAWIPHPDSHAGALVPPTTATFPLGAAHLHRQGGVPLVHTRAGDSPECCDAGLVQSRNKKNLFGCVFLL